MAKKQNNNNEHEIVDSKGGKLTRVGNNTKLIIGNIVDKILEIPDLAREILQSTDKSEGNYNELAKQDKKNIEKIIEHKLESGNYTDEELRDLLDRSEKITEKAEGVIGKLNKHRKEILLIVAGAMVTVLKTMIESRNNQDKS
ncbi:hypothetical protein SAMN05421676_10227 [Salinibacillus kushneri]|uniref:Uncharacterized protein n=1 Tax=Salinibacillus kushneri TaxID=237682 RepID=A0A1I0A3X4_9BACI|nr:hypothetical protein [Salinibacillus kushneri]SES88843.1 hypothetical protein SAMN05421676_10227 [Salinibacillus kushneri]